MKTHIQNLFPALAILAASFNSQPSTAHAQSGGVTWAASPGGAAAPWRSVASSADGTKFYAAGVGLWSSTDSGLTWTDRNNLGWDIVACSADGTKLIASGADASPVYTSTDSGTNWMAGEINPDFDGGNTNIYRAWRAVASSADGTKLVAVENPGGGTNGFIYISGTIIRPALGIGHQGNIVRVSWPDPSTGWTLQQNSNLTTGSWSPSSGVTNNGYLNYVFPSPTGNNMFFRLQQQK
jgi:hypothetical protein